MRDDTKRWNGGNAVGWTAHDEKTNGGRWRLVDGGAGLPLPALSHQRGLLGSLFASIRRTLPRLPSSSSSSSTHSHPRRLSLSSSTPETPSSSSSWSWTTIRFVFLCSLWYSSSAMSSNTGKVILNAYRYPVTLTIIQFAFVAGLSFICCQPVFGITTLRKPTRAIINSTVPMAFFQVGGHVFSSVAISRIPVSTVHTIKALSPMFTVAAYALLFNVKYSAATYLSLLPLTIGVMLACSFDVSASDFIGLLSAFGSAVVFVSSNIVFKKVMPSGNAPSAHKLDKINLLLYSSGMAFLMMIPVWMYSDLGALLSGPSAAERYAASLAAPSIANSKKRMLGPPPPALTILTYYVLNGTVHWAQNMLAFLILSSTSPVTYSIASLIKRIAVICIAVIYFHQSVHPVQGFGITLTFVGLWMYNQAKGDVEKGERKVRREEARNNLLLPNTREEAKAYGRSGSSSPLGFNDEKLSEHGYIPQALSSAIPRPNYDGQSAVHGGLGHAHSHTIASPAVPTSTSLPHPPFSSSGMASSVSSGPSAGGVSASASLPIFTSAPVPVPASVPRSNSHRHAAHVPPPLNLSSQHSYSNTHKLTSPPTTASYPSPPPSDSLGSSTPTSPIRPAVQQRASHEVLSGQYGGGAGEQVMKNRRATVDSGSVGNATEFKRASPVAGAVVAQ